MDDKSKKLLQFMLHNQPNSIIDEDIDVEIGRNAGKLSNSQEFSESGKKILGMLAKSKNKVAQWIVEFKTDAAKRSGAIKAQKEGYLSIKKQLIAEWQSGRYKTKVQCAEVLHKKMGVAYTTAIKYLKNIPKN
jgi:hypothetical protein